MSDGPIDKRIDKPMRRILEIFQSMESDSLDLHALFEAGGNDPAERRRVLDAVADMVEKGYLEPSGSDFYSLTAEGRKLIQESSR